MVPAGWHRGRLAALRNEPVGRCVMSMNDEGVEISGSTSAIAHHVCSKRMCFADDAYLHGEEAGSYRGAGFLTALGAMVDKFSTGKVLTFGPMKGNPPVVYEGEAAFADMAVSKNHEPRMHCSWQLPPRWPALLSYYDKGITPGSTPN